MVSFVNNPITNERELNQILVIIIIVAYCTLTIKNVMQLFEI